MTPFASPGSKHPLPLIAFLLCLCTPAGAQLPLQPVDRFSGLPRVVIISDIGNEPDDQMSLVRFLLYSKDLNVEALIASTSVWQKDVTHAEMMHQVIAAYGTVRGNLLLHAQGWPTQSELDALVFAGQPGYGMAVTGPGKSSAGSNALLAAMERNDSRPLWICLWAGANTLAQSLIDLRLKHTAAEVAKTVANLRVYAISDQDDAGQWIRREFPALFWVGMPSSQDGQEYYYATWTGISGDVYYRNGKGADNSLVTNEWLDQNIRAKGPLGKVYPKFKFIMEGDTPSYLGLLNNGLNSFRRPDWGGWGGRYVYRQPHGESHPMWSQGGDLFSRVTSQDSVLGNDRQIHTSDQATIWRWRTAYQNDFAARMDWTVSDFQHANHNPAIVVNGSSGTGIVELEGKEGDDIEISAAGTRDPDGQAVHFKWWHYPEAGLSGSHAADLTIFGSDQEHVRIRINSACRPVWFPDIPCRGDGLAHIILEVTDEGSPPLTSYRRIVLTVHSPHLSAGATRSK